MLVHMQTITTASSKLAVHDVGGSSLSGVKITSDFRRRRRRISFPGA
jgi:hypothetical protein